MGEPLVSGAASRSSIPARQPRRVVRQIPIGWPPWTATAVYPRHRRRSVSFELQTLLNGRRAEKFALFDRHLNPQLVRVLRTIGFDIDYVRAEGPYLFDAAGDRYLDLLSGFGVFAVGRNHPAVIRALQQVLDARARRASCRWTSRCSQACSPSACSPACRGLDKVFFCNSGTEAVEAAIKFAALRHRSRQDRLLRSRLPRPDHGRALAERRRSSSATASGRCCGDCASDSVQRPGRAGARARGNDVAAFIVEPIQGKGVNLPADGYLARGRAPLPRARHLARRRRDPDRHSAAPGGFWPASTWALEPDMRAAREGALGRLRAGRRGRDARRGVRSVFDRMERAVVHGSTFAKNDLAMAAGLATLAVMDEEQLVEHAADLGERLMPGPLGALVRLRVRQGGARQGA